MNLIRLIKEANWESYNIGFVEHQPAGLHDLDITGKEVHWLDTKGYRGGWMADPFILHADTDTVTLLAEELYTHLGRIVRLTVDRRGYRLARVQPLLELPTHLSFPIYIEEEGKLYLYPENYQSGGVNIYPLHPESYCPGAPVRIIDDPLVDTQITRIGDSYYAFGTMYSKGDNQDTRQLRIYRGDSLTGHFSLMQTIDTPHCRERGAGRIFSLDGKLIRPVQKCDRSYGEATILNELGFDGSRFSQTPIITFTPRAGTRWGRALHTYNFKDGVTVIDGLGYTHPLTHRLMRPVTVLIRLMRR